jgi:DNA-binding transcriptional regulator YdaS (Cro superfamily)
MTSDVKLTAEAVRLLVEQFGSQAHLAQAIGVTRTQLAAWCEGTEPVPLDRYRQMVDAVAAAGYRQR